MRTHEMKNRLDDALSGIREDARLYGRVLREAERERPGRRMRLSLGLIAAALLLIFSISAALAAAGGWDVLQFLFGGRGREAPPMDTSPVSLEAVSEGAYLKIDSALYDGTMLAFDWYIENKDPATPMYCRVETFTANGTRLWTDGTDGFDGQWLPGAFFGSSCRDGELILLPEEIQGAQRLHIDMRITLYRPTRPVWQMAEFDPAEAWQKAAEGYYVIAEGEGFVGYDPQEKEWTHWFGGPMPDCMGAYQTEELTAAFDLVKPREGYRTLGIQPSYENERCAAVCETAEITPMGLYLTLRICPKDGFSARGWMELTDGDGNPLTDWDGKAYFPSYGAEYGEQGGAIRAGQYCWNGLQANDLPDVISLTCVFPDGTKLIFPARVR